MPKFEELKQRNHVANHPLFREHDKRIVAMRENMSRTAGGVDLSDIFLQRSSVGLRGEDRSLNAYIQEAAITAQSCLDACEFPVRPSITYGASKFVRYAAHDENAVVDAEIQFNVKFASLSGVQCHAVLPVHVTAGSVVPPSTLIHNGRMRILAQSTVDEILQRNTTYELEPLRGQYDPPLEGDEIDRAVSERNQRGYQPRQVRLDAEGLRRTYGILPVEEKGEPQGVYYEEGDMVLFETSPGSYLVATVTERVPDLYGGRAGFHGVDPRTGMETSGYEDTIIDVIQPGEKEVHVARKKRAWSEILSRVAQDFGDKDWNVEGRPTEEDSHGLQVEKDHSPKDLDSSYKRDMPKSPERKREQDRNKDHADEVKRDRKKNEGTGKESSREAFSWPWSKNEEEEPAEDLEGFDNVATKRAYYNIVGNEMNFSRAAELAQISNSISNFGQLLQAEQGFSDVYGEDTYTGINEMGEINWDQVGEGVVKAAQGMRAASKYAQDEGTRVERPQAPQAPDADTSVTDPTMVAPMEGAGVPMTPMSTPSAPATLTDNLFHQITANDFIVQQVSAALNPNADTQVEMLYDSVSPLLNSLNISPQEVEWYNLLEDLQSYLGQGAATAVQGRKAAFLMAEHLSGRRRFGKRMAAKGFVQEVEEFLGHLEAGSESFTDEEFSYYANLAKEAKDAYDEGDERTADALLKDLKGGFMPEIPTDEVDPRYWQRFVHANRIAATDIADQVRDMEGMGQRSGEEDPEDFELVRMTPPGYDLVLGDMVEAEELGYDTFPRPYSHIEKNYILRRLPTCSRDQWYKHLVNDGFSINQWGVSRGRPRPGTDHKNATSKEALGAENIYDALVALGPRKVYDELPYILGDFYPVRETEVSEILDQVMADKGWFDLFQEWYDAEEEPMVDTESIPWGEYGAGGRSDADW